MDFGRISKTFQELLAKWNKIFVKQKSQDDQKIIPQRPQKRQNRNFSNNNAETKLIIFDKDGTLISFHEMWAPWCETVAERICQQSGLKVQEDVFRVLNYNQQTRKIGKGVLAEKTHAMVLSDLIDLLVTKHSVPENKAKIFVTNACNEANEQLHSTVKPVGDVFDLFNQLKKRGLKIAICTSDCREHTVMTIKQLKLDNLVDRVLCGDDQDNIPKPDPSNVHLICKDLGVLPENAVMIGDTPADVLMGRSSQCKRVIGVLSGVCQTKDLCNDADYVFNTVHDAITFFD